jgi:uncharacterized protein
LKQKLKVLENLQVIDQEIAGKQETQAEFTAAIATLDQAIVESNGVLEGLLAQVKVLDQDRAQLEVTLAAEQENVRRSETNMKEIRTNKEYQAVGREIAAARKQIAELEEQVLAKTVAADDLKTAIEAKKAELAELEQNSSVERKQKQSAIAEIQTEVETAKSTREGLAKQISSNVLKRYVQLRDQRRGQAMAEAKDGYCQGCNMNLPPQLYNTLFKGEELHFCPHCQRILFLKQEPPV